MDIETLALARAYTKQSLNGVGAIKGKPCTIKKIEEFDSYNMVTFAWTDNTGVERTSNMKVKNGLTIKSIGISNNDEIVITDYNDNQFKSEPVEFKGYAKLDEDGVIQDENLPEFLKYGRSMTGTWNASENVPELKPGIGNERTYYIVSKSGIQNIEGHNVAYPVGAYVAFENGAWHSIVVPPPEGGGVFTGTASIACGGIKKGVSFAGATVQEMFEALISPKLPPTITIRLAPSNTIYKKGTKLNNLKVIATPTKGTDALSKIEWFKDGTLIHTEDNGVTSGGAKQFEIAGELTANVTFKVVVTDIGGLTGEASQTIKFINPFYMGIVDSTNVTPAILESLTMVLNDKLPYTWENITMSNKRACIAYPSNLGALTSVKDGNGFDVLGAFEKTNVTVNGVVYFCYCMKETGTLNKGKMILSA